MKKPKWVTVRTCTLASAKQVIAPDFPSSSLPPPPPPAGAKKGPLTVLPLPYYTFPNWSPAEPTNAIYLACACCNAPLQPTQPACMCMALYEPLPRFQVLLLCHGCVDPYARGCVFFVPELVYQATVLLRPLVHRLWSKYGILTRQGEGRRKPSGVCYMCDGRGQGDGTEGWHICPPCQPAFALLQHMDPVGYSAAKGTALAWTERVIGACHRLSHCAPDSDAVGQCDLWGALATLDACVACGCPLAGRRRRICKCHTLATCNAPACVATAKSVHGPRCWGHWYNALATVVN